MTKEELMQQLHSLSGIGDSTPTEEQEKAIENIVAGFSDTSDKDAISKELETTKEALKTKTADYDALKKRYNDRFWHPEKEDKAHDPEPEKKPEYAGIKSIDELFN